MDQISDSELREIVERVVKRTMGGQSIVTTPTSQSVAAAQQVSSSALPKVNSTKVAAIGSDHGGFELKEILKKDLVEMGFEVVDCGTNNKEACDYPDFAFKVAQMVSSQKVMFGVMIDGAGIGSCMVANKVPGVRAAMCYDYSTAVNSKEHNDANLLTLGAGLIGVNLAKQILKTWITTEFAGGRHTARVDKIIAVDKKYLKGE